MKTLFVGGPKSGQVIDSNLQFFQVPIHDSPAPQFQWYMPLPEIREVVKLFTYKLTNVRIPYIQNGSRYYYIPENWSSSDLFDYFERAVMDYENQDT